MVRRVRVGAVALLVGAALAACSPQPAPSSSTPSASATSAAPSATPSPAASSSPTPATPSPSASPTSTSDATTYVPYANPIHNYVVEIPSWLTLTEPDANDGFVGTGKSSELRVYYTMLGDDSTMAAQMAALQSDGWALSYTVGDDGQGFTLSGSRLDQLIYVHTVIDGDQMLVARWTYPASAKAAFDAPVQHLAETLRFRTA